MEAVLLHGSVDQSISPYKFHIRNPNKIHRHRSFNISQTPSDQILLLPSSHFHGGLLQAPPPPYLSHSYPSFSLQKPPLPPLLPLPAATNPRRSSAAISRGLSLPPTTNKKTSSGSYRIGRDSSLTPKKVTKSRKLEEKISSPKRSAKQGVVGSSTSHLGPDPKELPKVVDMFSGSAAFAISPPPSSLPLPTFSLRPKLSCNTQAAAGVDTGATDNLRRLLRLR